ncbi:endonuclease domain-containing 1 protein-like [Garra rufa]|uniref:endonuclease domain-containing 1 protein-like n=1 Tax=Garra rufa TaxID=137080 RepID=UPI003CCE9CDF
MRLLVTSVLLVLGFPFITTSVVDSFSACNDFFEKEKPPEIEGVLKNSVSQDNNRYKLICQRHDGNYRYATLYDTTARIPLFSAYKYTGLYKKRPHIQWMIEPQLEPLDGTMSEPAANQASQRDYLKPDELEISHLFGVIQGLQRDYQKKDELEIGHLFPNSHAPDETTAESTFTLTNTVPQWGTFNRGSWRRMEQKVRDDMLDYCRDQDNNANILAYVLTGAVPGNKLLNKRVNIPSHMWTAFCCYNFKSKEWVSKAHWADENTPNPIPEKTLKELEDFLSDKFKPSELFSERCYPYFKHESLAIPEDNEHASWFFLF